MSQSPSAGQSPSAAISRACQQCEAGAPRLYYLPTRWTGGGRGPRVVCHFCYIRLSGLRPTRAALADGAGMTSPAG